MKLKELENHFKDIQWIPEVLTVKLNSKDCLEAFFSHTFEAEDDIYISYYWCDHAAGFWLVEKIEDALDNHNFNDFMAIKDLGEDIYLPNFAYVYNNTKDTPLGFLDLNIDTFYLIMDHEHECG